MSDKIMHAPATLESGQRLVITAAMILSRHDFVFGDLPLLRKPRQKLVRVAVRKYPHAKVAKAAKARASVRTANGRDPPLFASFADFA